MAIIRHTLLSGKTLLQANKGKGTSDSWRAVGATAVVAQCAGHCEQSRLGFGA